jgi:RNA-directed DNA polymerase
VPTVSSYWEGNTMSDDNRKPLVGAAESETLRMRGNSMHGNREIPRASVSKADVGRDGKADRSEKVDDRTSDTHVRGKSDGPIIPKKRTNKTGRPSGESAAESVEERGSTKGNAAKTAAHRTQGRGCASIGLEGVRQAARRDKTLRFTALLHHVTPELLEASYFALKRNAAPGVDGETWKSYGQDLQARLRDLHDRVHRGSYRAKPSKRAWIPKPDGRRRPLGIAALEDKIVQQAVRTVLEPIYEEDFLGFSYGFRPGRSCHNALDALWVGLRQRKVNWVLDADIRGFFDAIDHEWLMKFLEHRIADRRILRLIRKWLRAGVSDDGEWSRTTVGTPQGSVISPMLANVYLHYVLDLWVNQWRNRHARGDVIVVRYADDFAMGFQYRGEAERFLRELRGRLAKFGLALHPEKTRLLRFGRYAIEQHQERGQGKPETFDFLGFTHCCAKTRDGWYTIRRISVGKRMRATLQSIKVELRRRMHLPMPAQGAWLRSVVRGWFNYHAVPMNRDRLGQFRRAVRRLWLKAIRRRSQRGRRWTWARFSPLAERWLPQPRILHPYPNQRLTVKHPR